ncbi:MAG TPA: sulfur oxidation c-type cytochrome SoxA [Gammaproteobacteria bacterium]|nr:sulfur oxidation c-type cytochrome SoxA [Gammaproteobacteria bacterium]
MKRLIVTVTLTGFAMVVAAGAWATPKDDIAQYQGYYKKRFPGVALQSYSDGVNVLPQYAARRANWELLMEFPPYEAEMDKARAEWAKPFANGKTFSDCFKNNPPATKYPYVDAKGDMRSVVGDVNRCLKANGEKPIKNLKTGKIARLVAAFKEQFNGQKMAVNVNSPAALKWYDRGKKIYWTRRGQLNFSCASCHVQNAGNQIRGDVLGAGLGQGTGFPVYRTKWMLKGKPWGTLHRRYAGCNKNVRAKPFKPQSKEYLALEFYQAVMNTGISLKVPSQRQ